MKRTQHFDLANVALGAYAEQAGDYEGDDQTAVSDLVADLMHWCDVQGVDFDTCLLRGQELYSGDKGEADFNE